MQTTASPQWIDAPLIFTARCYVVPLPGSGSLSQGAQLGVKTPCFSGETPSSIPQVSQPLPMEVRPAILCASALLTRVGVVSSVNPWL